MYAKPTPTAEVTRGLFELRKGCKNPMRTAKVAYAEDPTALKNAAHLAVDSSLLDRFVLGPN